MKDVFVSPYQLHPAQPLNRMDHGRTRAGALLKVKWDDGLIGFADLHPWTELGDLELSQQLAMLQAGRTTPLSHSSLWLARRDAEARFVDRSLLPAQGSLKNNFLLSSVNDLDDEHLHQIKSQGFDTLKIKLGRDPKQELHQLRHLTGTSFKLRFDFNNGLNENAYAEFMAALPPQLRERIEYVEDPFTYDPKSWAAVRKWAPLAVDQDLARAVTHAPHFDVVILKPAKSDVAEVFSFAQGHGLKVAITSYMDHPVGMLHGAAIAHEMHSEYGDVILESGCLTHTFFADDAFAKLVPVRGPYIDAVVGSGIGFDEMLEDLPWQKLARL